jgi:hypothetical protein
VLTPWAGFAAGWMFLASKISAAGTVALGLAGYLTQIQGMHATVPTVYMAYRHHSTLEPKRSECVRFHPQSCSWPS